MKRSSTVMSVLGIASLIVLASFGYGLCWQPGVPHSGPPVGVPVMPGMPGMAPGCGPMPMPFCGIPCPPPSCGKTISLEGGARVLYATPEARVRVQGHGEVDFVRDLRFSQGAVLGEVYAAARIVPTVAFTYTFMIPREDRGNGLLPATIRVGNTIYVAGDRINLKYDLTIHRFEGEVYPIIGCNYRLGGWGFGELFVQSLRVENQANVTATESTSDFIMGLGGVGEFAASGNTFARVKGAYTFLQNQNGLYLEGEAKYFPEYCGGIRPYVGAGYRYRWTTWSREHGNAKWDIAVYGPFAEAGVIF